MIRANLTEAERILQRKLRQPSSLAHGVIVIPLNVLAEGESPLTTARWNVLRAIREHGRYDRLQDLADDLGRGKHRVSKDVEALVALGLVQKTKHGRETAVEADPREIMVA